MKLFKLKALFMLMALLFLTGCIDGLSSDDYDDDDDDDDDYRVEVYVPVAQYTVTTGRLLASQCAQCHGTNGYSVNNWDRLVGSDEIAREMYEYNTAHIMGAQTVGYTAAEINDLSYYFLTQ